MGVVWGQLCALDSFYYPYHTVTLWGPIFQEALRLVEANQPNMVGSGLVDPELGILVFLQTPCHQTVQL
jgi:hypothetical protein